MRKRMGRQDEEKAATSAPVSDVPRKTPAAPKQASPSKAKPAKEDPPASVQAQDNFEGHHEEKNMPLRKTMGSEKEDSEPEAGEQGFEEEEEEEEDDATSIASQSALGKKKFLSTKQQFIRLVDAYSERNIGRLTFKVVFSNSGLHVTHDDDVKNDEW